MWYGSDIARIEAKLDHVHQMTHIIADAVAAMALSAGDQAALAAAGATLEQKRKQLKQALDAFVGGESHPPREKERTVANPTVDAVIQQITATDNVIDSATQLITGFHDVIAQAVKDALAGGASKEDLAPVTDALAQIKGKTDALAAAVEANTSPPSPPPGPQPSAGQKPGHQPGQPKKP